MEVFHSLMSGAELRALRLFDDGELNLLISANALETDRRWKKNLGLIHKKKNTLVADSGMIGFVKRLGHQAIVEYALNPGRVLDIQLQVEPDVVVMTDLLLFPDFLARAGLSKEEAIAINRRNALFLAEKDISQTRLFVIQGEAIEGYLECIEWYEREGFFSIENAWFGIGSVAFRDPVERREIVRRIVAELSGIHVHVFGVGSPKYLLELNEMGVQSADSSVACMSGLHFSFIDENGKRRRLKIRRKDKYMTASLVAWNMSAINLMVRNGMVANQLELFEE